MAGSLAAFLIFNFKPASIFMGDSGSLLIGSSLAILTLNYSEASGINTLSQVAVPILVLMVPIFDTTLVTTHPYLKWAQGIHRRERPCLPQTRVDGVQ